MTEEKLIEGLKLIKLNSSRIDIADDPTYPFKLEVNLRPPELGGLVFMFLCGGTEELVLRGMTRAALDSFIEQNDLMKHPRLRWMKISGPDGFFVEFAR